jgi:hypothetical protein
MIKQERKRSKATNSLPHLPQSERNQEKFKEILVRLVQLHEAEQKKILVSEKVDLNDFLSYTQKDLNLARSVNSHEFTKNRFDNDILLRESLQRVIVKLIKAKEINSKKPDTPSMIVTSHDRVLRELNIINVIFKSQFRMQSEIEWLQWPQLVNSQGKDVDGQYLFTFSILSNVELFNIQRFKSEITNRYESAVNLNLLRNQLTEIWNKAAAIRDFYNENLTDKKVSWILEKFDVDYYNKMKEHGGVVEVLDHYVRTVHFGVDTLSINRKFLPRELCERRNDDETERPFNYVSNNRQLANICQTLVTFIEGSTILKKDKPTQKGNVPIIPLDDVNKIRDNLIGKKYLTDKGENTKAKPLVAVLLGELAKKYGIDKSNVLKQVAPVWKLSSTKTKNFKLSKSKTKLQEYEVIATSILQ